VKGEKNLTWSRNNFNDLEVSIENNLSTFDSQIFYAYDPDPDDLPVALRRGKRSCAMYPISQFVSSKHLSLQHKSCVTIVDSVRIPTFVQEALKDAN